MKKLLSFSLIAFILLCSVKISDKDIKKIITNKVKSELKYPNQYKNIKIETFPCKYINNENEIYSTISKISVNNLTMNSNYIKSILDEEDDIEDFIKFMTPEELFSKQCDEFTEEINNIYNNIKINNGLFIYHDFYGGINCKRHCNAVIDSDKKIVEFSLY